MHKRIICVILASVMLLSLFGCSKNKVGVFTEETQNGVSNHGTPIKDKEDSTEDVKTEEQSSEAIVEDKIENAFIKTEENEISTVSLSPEKASYYYFRSLVNKNYTLDQLKMCSYGFKVEEFLNYFDGSDFDNKLDETFYVNTSLIDCPWNEETKLFKLTLAAADSTLEQDNNFVFCIDVSESMARDNVLPLFKSVFPYFLEKLGENDKVSVIACSDVINVVVDGAGVEDADDILLAVESLEIGNGANANTDFSQVYGTAEKHFIKDGNNRVVFVSDGDMSGKLVDLIEENTENDIFTSIIGLGDSNYKNEKLGTLAGAGRGRYYYIDCESSGERIMGDIIFRPIVCVAQNLASALRFNSDRVEEYRLIGYVQSGEATGEGDAEDKPRNIYAGDVVTLVYELKFIEFSKLSKLDFASVTVMYDESDRDYGRMVEFTVFTNEYIDKPKDDIKFLVSVMESVMLLQSSEFIGEVTFDDVISDLEGMDLEEYPERAEFRELLKKIVNGVIQ